MLFLPMPDEHPADASGEGLSKRLGKLPSTAREAQERKPAQPFKNHSARREQNRRASKAYREKRKQRLALLDEILYLPVIAEADGGPLVDELATAASSVGQPTAAPILHAISPGGPPCHLQDGGVLAPGSGTGLSLPDDTASIIDPALDATLDIAMAPTPLLPGPACQHGGEQFVDPMALTTSSSPQRHAQEVQLALQANSAAPLVSDQRPLSEALQALPRIDRRGRRKLRELLALMEEEDSDTYAERRRFASAERSGTVVAAFSSGTPRLRAASRISVRQQSFFGAIYANAAAIGIGGKTFLNCDDSVSLFYRGSSQQQQQQLRPQQGMSGAGTGDGFFGPTAALLAADLAQLYADVAMDLRPVLAQLTVEHHPYLDVIPFRTFRERALAAICCSPPLFSEEELCQDLLSDGLVCWGGGVPSHAFASFTPPSSCGGYSDGSAPDSSARGSTTGSSSSSSSSGSQGMDAAVPWDARAWEPREWFLHKYWFLVGGFDDEMWRCARFWQALRGDESDEADDV